MNHERNDATTGHRPGYVSPEPPPVGAPGHDEAMIDDAIEQTFPASDPSAISAPGSSINRSHTSNRRDAVRGDDDARGAVEF